MSVSRTEPPGNPVTPLQTLILVFATVLSVACENRQQPAATLDSTNLGPPILQEGAVYAPVSVGESGCVLYSVRIPGGYAPAALVYRNQAGEFSYAPPERCAKEATTP